MMIANAIYHINKLTYTMWVAVLLVMMGLTACNSNHPQGINGLSFSRVESSHSNIDFNNKITESDSINVYKNEYMYNGSGVAIGDFNNDGLQDVFMCGSMVSSRLYINKGGFVFEDVTKAAGVETNQWCTGAAVADINNDGFADIYVSSSHSPNDQQRKNLLFINDGKGHFTNQAEAYGLADTGYSTQAAFFDFDKDGDLDLYLLNHRLYNRNPNNLVPKDTSGNSPAQDRLYRNDGRADGTSHPVFTDITINAGIKEDGYGLGIVITDVNGDNWPDVYVANDYIGNDLLWLNNQNGTFTNTIAQSLKHQSFNSMGVDAADINNDGLPDIGVLDMSPETNERKKMMFMASGQEKYDMERRLGYEPSFVRNVLQLHNGNRTVNGQASPFYSEIGQLAGISETDWSWSILMADFDNNGFKDIHITNGLAKDVTNNDYVAFKNSQNQHEYGFSGTADAGAMNDKTIEALRKNLDQYGEVRINNYFYLNNGDLTFNNATAAAGLATPSISNGAAYADLDNDGDLDLVVNNMNEQAFVWRNDLRSAVSDTAYHFLSIQLKGTPGNIKGIGAKVWLYQQGQVQFVEQSPVRGFCSSVDDRLHFGLAQNSQVDSIKIIWPDNQSQLLQNVSANQFLVVDHSQASYSQPFTEMLQPTFFTGVPGSNSIDFIHRESQYFDFGNQRLVPQKYSQLGPCIATGDVDGDGLEDIFVGGAARQSGVIFIQQKNGQFQSKKLVEGLKDGEDVAAVFFDFDGDKDVDLLVCGGSQEFGENAPYNQPRLYTNDGKGDFTLNNSALPKGITDIIAQVAALDYDNDGDVDLFLGGRMVPQKYPQSPRSYILQNNNGHFVDVTRQVCPALEYAGLVTGAVFTDFNKDHLPDLVVCGEWMPVRFFENRNGSFTEITEQTGIANLVGQWRSLQAADLDGDGDMDFVAGNLGANNKFHITPERPFTLVAADFDANNTIDLVPAYYIKNNRNQYELFPYPDRGQLADAIPAVKKKYLLNSTYASLNLKDLVKSFSATNLMTRECRTTATAWIENKGKGRFEAHKLPLQAQFAPVNAICIGDFNADGIMDILLAGNEYQAEVVTGRYDASYGTLLLGDKNKNFSWINNIQSGFIIDGDVKALAILKRKELAPMLIAGVNDGAVNNFLLKAKNTN